jgi:hypothetical protein
MILVNRSIPIICPLFVFISFEIFFRKPLWIYWLFPILIVVLVMSVWKLIGRGLITVGARWNFLIAPFFLLTGGLFFILFLENQIFKHFLVILLAVLLGLFLENIFIYIYRHDKYQVNSLENISSYLNLISTLFFCSGFFGLLTFLNISVWLLILLILLVIVSLSYQTIWINKIISGKSWLYILIICLISCELAWTLFFLPISFYVSGAVLSIAYYLVLGISRFYLLGNLDAKIVKRHLIISLIVLILILGTARWM